MATVAKGGPAQTRIQELVLGLPRGQQGTKYLNHLLMIYAGH